ncbi:hypothetical protein CTAYLR_007470 [Chrysophaeum taylorii]|uniref:Receptor ligand binding region domain-containing protein n=1 Tax=Chrysophaeum taylorii TaxID=2483200 RepID=A0AAD7UBE0_9STRA|nr:hypothetical protein CTAYLR_007470 [Chrysophaeum taylorii]
MSATTGCDYVINISMYNTRVPCPCASHDLRSCRFASPFETIQAYRQSYMHFDAIIGAGRSDCSAPLAINAGIDLLPQISYLSTSPSLDAKGTYPFFTRTIPSDNAAAVAVADFLVYYGWTRAAIIHVVDTYGNGYASAMASACQSRGINCESVGYETQNAKSMETAVDFVMETGSRVFVGIMYDWDLESAIGLARSRNLTGTDSMFIFSDSISSQKITELEGDNAEAVRGGARIYATGAGIGDPGDAAFATAYRTTYNASFYNKFLEPAEPHATVTDAELAAGKTYDVANYAYDAVVALGLAACGLQANGTIAAGRRLLDEVYVTTFHGASGKVAFDSSTGSRNATSANYVVENFKEVVESGTLESVVVGVWAPDGWSLFESFEFNDGTQTPPLDYIDLECGNGMQEESGKCTPCPKGMYRKAGTKLKSCIPCPKDWFAANEGSTECTSCGPNAMTKIEIDEGADSPTDCVGNYSALHNNTCMTMTGKNIDLSESKVENWCIRGRSYEAPLCEDPIVEPDNRYYQIVNLVFECPRRGLRWVHTLVSTIVLVSLFFFINDVVRDKYQLLDLVLDVYQDCGIIASFRFQWPRQLEYVFIAFVVALFDVDAYARRPAMPFFHAALRAAWALATTNWTADDFRRVAGSSLSFLITAFPSLVATCQSAFTCRKFQGHGRMLVESPPDACGTREHTIVRVVAVLYFAVFIVGAPFAIITHLSILWRRNALCRKETLLVYGFLYKAFHSDALWWGGVRLAKHFVLVSVSILAWSSPRSQGLTAICLLIMIAAQHSRVQPCLSRTLNRFELGGLLLAILFTVLGLLFASGRTHLQVTKEQIKFERRAFVYIFFFSQAVYLACAVVLTSRESVQVADRQLSERKLGQSRLQRAYAQAQLLIGETSPEAAAETTVMRNAVPMPLPRRPETVPPRRLLTNSGRYSEPVPQLELLNSFKGRAIKAFVLSKNFERSAAREVSHVEELDRAIAPYVSDDSLTNNYSNSMEASFFRRLDSTFPAFLDLLVDCSEDVRIVLRKGLAALAEATYCYKTCGRFSITQHLIQRIDRSSVCFFLLYAPPAKRAAFREFLNKVVEENPYLRVHCREIRW